MRPGTLKCRVRSCARLATYKTKTLCHTHYEKLRRSGTLAYRTYRQDCKRCGKPVVAKALCQNHYMKLKRTGTFKVFRERVPVGWTPNQRHRFYRYGLRPEDMADLQEFQDHACAICREPFRLARMMHVDHGHTTGRTRGLLCGSCNTALCAIEKEGVSARFFQDYLDDWKLYHEEETA